MATERSTTTRPGDSLSLSRVGQRVAIGMATERSATTRPEDVPVPAGARSPRCRRSPSLTPPPRPTACAPLSAAAGRPGPTRNCGAATHSTQCAIVGQTPVVATGHGVPNWIGHAPGQAAGTPTRSPTRRRPRKRQPQQLRTSVARKKRESGVMVCGVLLRISLPRRMKCSRHVPP